MPQSTTHEPLDSLVTLVSQHDADIRPTLLLAITDLYVQKPSHTAEEQEQYTELALGLLPRVDAHIRALVAARLRDYPDVPREILRQLAESDSEEMRANARRTASIQDDLIELFFTATSDERRLILINLDVALPTFEPPLRISADAAARLAEVRIDSDTNEMTRLLERIVGVSRVFAERIVNDVSGEPLVVIAKAIGMNTDALRRIILALNPGMGKSAISTLALIRLFDEIPARVAAYMVYLWQRSTERLMQSYESLHWNDEHRDARSLSNPTPHAVNRDHMNRDRHAQGARFKAGSR